MNTWQFDEHYQQSIAMAGASFREERLTLAERGKIDVFKINDDDDDEVYEKKLHYSASSGMKYQFWRFIHELQKEIMSKSFRLET